MAGRFLDTNHIGFCLNPGSPLRERIRTAHRSGQRFGTSVPVLCELKIYIAGGSKPEPSRRLLRVLLPYVKIWPLEPVDAAAYAAIFFDLKRRGRVMSQVDMMVAALVRRMKLTLLSTGRDFDAFPDIRREDWVTAS